MDLRKKTYNAVFWSFIDRGGEQLIRFVFSIVLARILLPEHFGLLGMAYVVTEIARVFVQSGFGLALINKKDAKKIDECSIFYFNVFIGALSTILIFTFSPIIGNFYKSKELVPILRILSLNVFLGSFGIIQTVLMTKRIDFKTQTKVSLPATLLSGAVGIALAFSGFGVWSLVIQTILRTIFNTVFLWLVHSWRPSFLFSFGSLRVMFTFGSKLLLGSLVQMIFGNIYTIMIGKLFSPTQLGYYTRATQTQQLPLDTIWSIIWRVTFPVFSSIKDEPDKFRHILSKASCNITFLVFPFMVIGAIIAPTLFRLLFGEKWVPSVILFQILCIASLFNPLESLWNNTILAKGHASLQFKLQLFKYINILLSLVFAFTFGIKGLLIAYGAVSYLNIVLISFFVERETGYKMSQQLTDFLPSFICTALSGLSVYLVSFLKIDNLLTLFSIQIITSIAVYLISSFLFKIDALYENSRALSSLIFRNSNI